MVVCFCNRYFAALRAHPEKYIYTRHEIGAWLKRLRQPNNNEESVSGAVLTTRVAKPISLFLITNSHLDYTCLLMRYAFGDQWPQLFDLTLTYSRKPDFFNSKTPLFGVFILFCYFNCVRKWRVKRLINCFGFHPVGDVSVYS